MDSVGKDKAPHPVRFRKEGSRNQTTEIGTVIADGIGTINCRVWMHKARVWRAHREVIRLFLSIDVGCSPLNGTLLGRFSVRIKGTVKANKLVYNNWLG